MVEANIGKLRHHKFYNKRIFDIAKKNIFPRVKSYKELNEDQRNLLHCCLNCIAASYIVDKADKIKITIGGRRAGRWEVMGFADDILSRGAEPNNLRLYAIAQELCLQISFAAMVNEKAKLYIPILEAEGRSGGRPGSKEKELWMFMYENYSYAPIF